MPIRHAASLLIAIVSTIASALALAAQRTFVSAGGSDANACSLVAPCRSFSKAITLTDVAGEIVVLDSGGYGAVSVNKNVTILSPAGVYAGLSVFAGNDGITVVNPATKVVLRGLSINGQGGNNGIRVQAGEVHIESSVISNMGQAGILVEGGSTVRVSSAVMRSNADGIRVAPTAAGTVSVIVRDSESSNNTSAGIGVSPSAAGTSAQVTVERSSVTKNGAGVVTAPSGSASATIVLMQSVASENAGAGVSASGATATVWVRESAITRNGTGLQQASSAILNACGANLLVANTTAQSGAINTSSCLDVASGSGTVTSVGTGSGLSGGPITTSGTINLASTQLLPTVACGPNQIAKWSGSAWACAADANSGGTVTSVTAGSGLIGGTITTSGTIAVDPASTTLTGNYFKQGGNAFGATAAVGTTDNNTLDIQVNATRALRIVPDSQTPYLIGGSDANSVAAGASGGVVVGGGGPGTLVSFGSLSIGCSSGCDNRVTGFGTIGGGAGNQAGNGAADVSDAGFATVGGGHANTASAFESTVGGGDSNTASGDAAVVAGGSLNAASIAFAAIGGGFNNHASGPNATIGGGVGNTASGSTVTVGGGNANTASGSLATVAGGNANAASGSRATVAGGESNVASGSYAFAAGRRAKTEHLALIGIPPTLTTVFDDGAFVFADSSNFDFNSTTDNQFTARATGGVRFVLGIDGSGNPTWTCSASSGSAWSCSSDRNLKQNLVQLDGRDVLERLAKMPVYQWQPKGANAQVKHYGPMAQDFHAAFALGDDDMMIGMQDADGVALAAIQGLHEIVGEQRYELQRKNDEIVELRAAIASLAVKVEALGAH